MISFPFFLTCYAGFTHAFEADHMLAVSNLVSQRNKTTAAIKDGLFWGAGHTSTLLVIGIIVFSLRLNINQTYFNYLEACVGLMLIMLGFYRLVKWMRHTTHPASLGSAHGQVHYAAYSVGLMHGLAGSGSLLLIVMSQVNDWFQAILFLILFGVGSVVGMMLVAGVFSLPYGRPSPWLKKVQHLVTFLSSVLCVGYGSFVVYEKLIQTP